MSSWLSRDQFLEQLQNGGDQHTKPAPCPSDFSEGRSYWIEKYAIDFEEQARTAELPSDVDIVIIGTGITGAAALHILANRRPELKVAILDARGICSGATGRNGGHWAAEGTDLRSLIQENGLDEAIRLSHLGTRNRDLMFEAIEKLDIADDIDLKLEGTRVVFASEAERKAYLDETTHAASIGISLEGRFVEAAELSETCHFSIEKANYGAACIEKSGSIYPRKLVAALLRDAMKRIPGLTVHSYTPARSVEMLKVTDKAPSYTVKTDKGFIRCRAVVHATNAYASYLIPSLRGVDGVLGCKAECIAIKPNVVNSDEAQGLRGRLGFDEFWHWMIQRPNGGPFIYGWSGVEMVGDYDGSKVLPRGEDAGPAGHKVMREFLETGFPHSFQNIDWGRDVSHRWTGIQGFTKTGVSLVGRISKDNPGEFISVGHNGEGMGRCFASATVVTDRLLHYLDGKEEGNWSAPDWFPRSFLYNI